ncbi:GNAT family N-acetyltransferase [Planococcus dechangensis]|uniref:GNAT family N-acetyltransferase n=1 Tax=Planococcus dechangensis TaxID=1176255 RepID=A0ABV9MDG8_9BACL
MTLEIQIPIMTIVENKEEWNQIVKTFAIQDVYYTYEYNEWNAEKENGNAKLVYFQNSLASVIYPFIIRKIDCNFTEQPIYDITNAYGYGGPICIGDPGGLKEFGTLFREYCKNMNIISEVVRLHPLIDNASYLDIYCKLQYIRKTTAVDLTDSLQNIQQRYSPMTRRNIKKALSNHLQCRVVEKSDENIAMFLKLYNDTMCRKEASNSYYFNSSIIKKQLEDTGVSKSFLIFVYYGERVIAAVILLMTKRFAHYHLGASDKLFLSMRPNNLLFDFMVSFSKENGCETLHLGGGYQEDDSLFKYKTSFTNQNNYDYYLGTNIYDDALYEKLTLLKNNSDSERNFFPLYRKP